jgi:hypothetical protein
LLFTIPFNIKFGSDYFFNIKNILVSYVSLIRTGMNGDAVSAETLSVYGSFYHIRIIPTAAVAKCGEFVYVDRKPDHLSKIIYRPKAECQTGLKMHSYGEHASEVYKTGL